MSINMAIHVSGNVMSKKVAMSNEHYIQTTETKPLCQNLTKFVYFILTCYACGR